MRFYTVVLVAVSVALGYSLAVRPADASSSSIASSLERMAVALEGIERRLSK